MVSSPCDGKRPFRQTGWSSLKWTILSKKVVRDEVIGIWYILSLFLNFRRNPERAARVIYTAALIIQHEQPKKQKVCTGLGKNGTFGLTLTRFCGVSERENSLRLLLIGDRTDVAQ